MYTSVRRILCSVCFGKNVRIQSRDPDRDHDRDLDRNHDRDLDLEIDPVFVQDSGKDSATNSIKSQTMDRTNGLATIIRAQPISAIAPAKIRCPFVYV